SLVMFLAVAMVALTQTFSMRLKAHQRAQVEAQLRQALLAGGMLAQQELPRGIAAVSNTVAAVPIPAIGEGEGVSLGYELRADLSDPAMRATVEVHARLDDRSMRQVIRYQRDETGWSVVAAALDPVEEPVSDDADGASAPPIRR